MFRILLIIMFITSSCLIFAKITESKMGDGTKVAVDTEKSTKTIYRPDGSKQVINLKGKTPYGMEIDRVQTPVQIEPEKVFLTFEPSMSDELCVGNVRIFFDELNNSLKAGFSETPYEGKNNLIISVAFCRYGEYGFCTAKAGNVFVFIRKNKKVVKNFTVTMVDLKEKNSRKEFIKTIIDAL